QTGRGSGGIHPSGVPRPSRAFVLALIGSFVAVSVLSGLAIWFVVSHVSPVFQSLRDLCSDRAPSNDPTSVYFAVRPGANARQVADDLLRAGLIVSTTRFRTLAEATGQDKKLQSGNYELRRNMTAQEVLKGL